MNNIGNLKSLLPKLWENLACNQRYRTYVDKRDIETFKQRVLHEGLAFLTVKLPSLGKALDRMYSTSEYIPPPDFTLGDDRRPKFLGRCLARAIEGNPVAVECYRQLTLIFYKLEVRYDEETEARVLLNFKTIDRSLDDVDLSQSKEIIALARRIIGRVLVNQDPLDIRPCHGTGATACRTKNHEKWHKLRYFRKLDEHFSYPDYFFYSPSHLVDEMERLEEAEVSIPRARVCLVPKDSRGPRIISCEPAELMFIQQGLMRKLYKCIENHPLTRSFVNFEDQTINRTLAREASITGDLATIDLSDASDRVSLNLVRSLFPSNWVRALEACRSEETELPSGEIVKLNKFAPMGSSVCFPVEALVFWAIAYATLRISDPSQWPRIYVYGDDIIVDSVNSQRVMDGLEAVGLKVNRDKSYCSGPFRESCGGDFYVGHEVTPVRLKKPITSSQTSAVAVADLINNFINKFGLIDSFPIIDLLFQELGYPLPFSPLGLPACVNLEGRSSNDVYFRRRWNTSLQRVEHRIPQPYTKTSVYREAAWCELLRKELTRDVPSSPWVRNDLKTREVERSLQPGAYADTHSARMKWVWTWLG
jgi:hypothetical protein